MTRGGIAAAHATALARVIALARARGAVAAVADAVEEEVAALRHAPRKAQLVPPAPKTEQGPATPLNDGSRRAGKPERMGLGYVEDETVSTEETMEQEGSSKQRERGGSCLTNYE